MLLITKTRPMAAALDTPILSDADKAREHFEAQRWPNNNRTKLSVTDVMRRDNALKGIDGKRLTYRRIGGTALA